MRLLSGKLSSLLKSPRRLTAARFFLISCFFLCAGILLFQGVDYLLSLHRDAVSVCALSAPVQRFSLPDASVQQKMDINQAQLEDLTRVSGIGPTIAKNILAYRDSLGGFHFLEELLDVSGVGQKRFDALQELFFCPSP